MGKVKLVKNKRSKIFVKTILSLRKIPYLLLSNIDYKRETL